MEKDRVARLRELASEWAQKAAKDEEYWFGRGLADWVAKYAADGMEFVWQRYVEEAESQRLGLLAKWGLSVFEHTIYKPRFIEQARLQIDEARKRGAANPALAAWREYQSDCWQYQVAVEMVSKAEQYERKLCEGRDQRFLGVKKVMDADGREKWVETHDVDPDFWLVRQYARLMTGFSAAIVANTLFMEGKDEEAHHLLAAYARSQVRLHESHIAALKTTVHDLTRADAGSSDIWDHAIVELASRIAELRADGDLDPLNPTPESITKLPGRAAHLLRRQPKTEAKRVRGTEVEEFVAREEVRAASRQGPDANLITEEDLYVLSPTQREFLQLLQDGYEYKEIAALHKKSVGHVKRTVHDARERIKKEQEKNA